MKFKQLIFGSFMPLIAVTAVFLVSIKKLGGVTLIGAAGAAVCLGAWILTSVAKEYFRIGSWSLRAQKAFGIFSNPPLVLLIGSWTFYCLYGGLSGMTILMIVAGAAFTLALELFDFFKTVVATRGNTGANLEQ